MRKFVSARMSAYAGVYARTNLNVFVCLHACLLSCILASKRHCACVCARINVAWCQLSICAHAPVCGRLFLIFMHLCMNARVRAIVNMRQRLRVRIVRRPLSMVTCVCARAPMHFLHAHASALAYMRKRMRVYICVLRMYVLVLRVPVIHFRYIHACDMRMLVQAHGTCPHASPPVHVHVDVNLNGHMIHTHLHKHMNMRKHMNINAHIDTLRPWHRYRRRHTVGASTCTSAHSSPFTRTNI